MSSEKFREYIKLAKWADANNAVDDLPEFADEMALLETRLSLSIDAATNMGENIRGWQEKCAALEQQVSDAEWLRDKGYKCRRVSVSVATGAKVSIWQVYGRPNERIGKESNDYWQAIHNAREAEEKNDDGS